MSALGWSHPEWGALLAALVLGAGVALAWARRSGARRLARLVGGRSRRSGDRPRAAPLAPDLVLWLAFAAIALALAGPRLGTRTVRVPATGIDVAVLLDVSRSMDARDVPPSRMVRAREAARAVLRDLRPGDRAALAAFAGRGALLTPLTADKRALVELLPTLDAELVADRGSSTGGGLEAALAAFDERSPRPRALLLLSDGEHADRTPDAAVRAAERAGVLIVTAAIGTAAGAPVPTRSGPLRDATGARVVSRRDAAALAAIARTTRGEALVADGWGGFEPGALDAALRRGARPVADGWLEQEVPSVRYRALAGLALALLLLEAAGLASRGGWRARLEARLEGRGRGDPDARPSRGSGRPARAAAVALALALAAGGAALSGPSRARADSDVEVEADAEPLDARVLEARLRERPDDALLLLRLGMARIEEDAVREAERAFLAAAVRASDPDLAALAYYDLGVALTARGHYEGARDAFLDALALAPGDERARYNLEWVLQALAQREGDPKVGAHEAGAPTDPGDEPDREGEPDRRQGEGDTHREEREAEERAREDARERGEAAPAPDPGDGAGRAAAAPAPVRLTPEEARRWLEAVRDEPGYALEAATRGGPGGERRLPRW